MASKVRVTAEQFATRWSQGLKSSTTRITEGVQRVTESPGKRAATKVDKWYAAITSEQTRTKWRNAMNAMTLEEWQQAMTQKGVGRIAAGVDAAQLDMRAYGEALINFQNKLLTQLDSMPDVTLEDSISRMVAWTRGMAGFTG